MSPEQLLQQAQARGMGTIALTDINCTAGWVDLFRLAPQYQVRPLAGIEFRAGHRLLYIGLAMNNQGLLQLNELLTAHLLHGEALPVRAPESVDATMIYPMENAPHTLRPNEYIGIRPHELGRARFSPLTRHMDRLLALYPVTFRHKRDHNVHRLLRAIGTNTLLSRTPPEQVAPPTERMPNEEEFCAAYQDAPELVQNTRRLMDRCSVHFDLGKTKNLRSWSGDAAEDRRILREEADRGLLERYGKGHVQAQQRLEKELAVITQKDMMTYFLINWDLVRFARRKGFFHVGRGSGANSLTAYCLGITDVDPLELDLYFERFINPSRSSPPDFDLDFSWKDRDTVTGYLFDTYGSNNRVALLATYSTYRSRAVVRELGKVFGLPPAEIAALGDRHAVERGPKDEVGRTIARYAPHLLDIPSHLSIHVGGVLISEDPLTCYTALHRPPKGLPTTQFSMFEAEDLGLYKFDILSQRGLGHIRDAVDLVEKQRGIRINIHDVARFKTDPAIRDLLSRGDTVGAFYVESPAMRMLLKKLRVRDYMELVAASSIIRPGVSSSGMMREYILRHHDPALRTRAHPALLEIMPDTYGVMVYQEDVIKVAHFYAGLSFADADILRRGMSGKYRSRQEFARVREKWFANCRTKGHPDADAAEIWRQVESFAGYSFAKGHSASYAVESYQSLFLKAHYPLEFMVGVANNFGGFYHTEFYLNEARRHGARILPPCINRSDRFCSLHGTDIHVGLGMVHQLEERTVNAILHARMADGPFTSLQDLLRRVPLAPQQARILIRAGALNFTGRMKPDLLWELLAREGSYRPCGHADLFAAPEKEFTLPPLRHPECTDAFDEMELLGYPLSDPFALLASPPGPHVPARDMHLHLGREVRMLGYVVHVKPATTVTGDRMEFGCFMDPCGDLWDSTHFPDVARRQPILGRGIHVLTGRVEEEFGHWSLRTSRVERLPYRTDPRYTV
jgi:error-prone DNA polymerase